MSLSIREIDAAINNNIEHTSSSERLIRLGGDQMVHVANKEGSRDVTKPFWKSSAKRSLGYQVLPGERCNLAGGHGEGVFFFTRYLSSSHLKQCNFKELHFA